MANDAGGDPIIIDTEGVKPVSTDKHRIKGIKVVASGDTWEVILHKTGSNLYRKFFHDKSDITNDRGSYTPFPNPNSVQGIYATTLTDIEEVLVYTEATD